MTQLHDHNKAISMEALDILDEACEDKVSVDFRGWRGAFEGCHISIELPVPIIKGGIERL